MGVYTGAKSIITDGLILHIDLANPRSNVTGTTIYDLTDYNHDATIVNSPTYFDENAGGILLDSTPTTPQYLSLEPDDNNPLFQPGTGDTYTMCVWFKPIKTVPNGVGNTGNNAGLMQRGMFEGSYGFDLRDNNDSICFFQRTDSESKYTSTHNISNSLIYYAVGVCDGVNIKLYINGEFKSSTGVASGDLKADFVQSSRLRVGNERSAGGAGATDRAHFVGNVYNVSYYNRVLTDDEILQNFNALKWRYPSYFYYVYQAITYYSGKYFFITSGYKDWTARYDNNSYNIFIKKNKQKPGGIGGNTTINNPENITYDDGYPCNFVFKYRNPLYSYNNTRYLLDIYATVFFDNKITYEMDNFERYKEKWGDVELSYIETPTKTRKFFIDIIEPHVPVYS